MSKNSFFPNAEDVFYERIEEHTEFLLPLLSVNVEEFLEGEQGKLHFVLPLEPFDCLGLETKKFHNYYCRTNWIAYKLIDNKLSLLTDFNFFQKQYISTHIDYKETFGGVESYLNDLPNDLEEEFQKLKLQYSEMKEHKKLVNEERVFEYFDAPYEYIYDSFPTTQGLDNISIPLTEDGRSFKYIGKIDICDLFIQGDEDKWYSIDNDTCIIMYYDPQEKIILNTFFGS
ncbi:MULTISPECIES: hypothetical protein [unclassified Pseudoalteromonas]|uniref:hypothetical protein n=1 Tax=unclassified Pseudoalteromonas TaxID=194690 RepID=UPI000C088DD6|nr:MULTISPECIES: hypothetical protein [unclassified Pseudoalteromonas]MDP2635140.1 hypothetical protein [Pseudoalteromonas sp. 1_MG-2023]PHN91499.1 hypothetical protein CSC79_00185 [Pseudoalteromonas sp. 3D05]